jgi:hypothetical protein
MISFKARLVGYYYDWFFAGWGRAWISFSFQNSSGVELARLYYVSQGCSGFGDSSTVRSYRVPDSSCNNYAFNVGQKLASDLPTVDAAQIAKVTITICAEDESMPNNGWAEAHVDDITISYTQPAPLDFSAPYSATIPTMDGVLNPAEWADASLNIVTMVRQDGAASHAATLYLKHDGTWLYVGIDSGFNDVEHMYWASAFDGNNSHANDGNASEPRIDISLSYPGPSGHSYYDRYDANLASGSISVTPPVGTAKASAGSNPVTFEFKIKLAEFGVSPGGLVGFKFQHGHDGSDGYGYPRIDPPMAEWPHLRVLAPTLSDGLVAYYPFNGDANDESGNGHNGTIVNAVLASDRFGKPNNCYSFNGINAYITIINSSDLSPIGDFSVSVWLRQNSSSTPEVIMSKSLAGYDSTGWFIALEQPNWLQFQATPYFESNSPTIIRPPTNEWHHVTFTFTRSTGLCRSYLNGILVDSRTRNYSSSVSPRNLTIGSQEYHVVGQYNYFFSGQLDDVRIYNRALSSNEIQTLYWQNNGINSTLSTISNSPSSAPADGNTAITVTVTLKDQFNNPVPGKIVTLYAGTAPVKITEPVLPTDANGQITATITATTPCTAAISVIAPVIITQPATVQFTPPSLVLPDPALSNAIVSLYQETANILHGSVAYKTTTSPPFSVTPVPTIVTNEGQIGDDFQKAAGAAQAAEAIDAVFGIASMGMTVFDVRIIDGKVADEIVMDTGNHLATQLGTIAQSSSGLSTEARAVVNVAASRQQALQQAEQTLLAGLPQASASMAAAYTDDLQRRLYANYVLLTVLEKDDALLNIYQDALITSSIDPLMLTVAEAGGAITVIAITGGAAVPVLAYSAATLTINELGDNQSFNDSQKAYLKAVDLLIGRCTPYAEEIYSNSASGFSAISQSATPRPVTGTILAATNTAEWNQITIPSQYFDTHSIGQYTTSYLLRSESSIVTIQNTSSSAAGFEIFALCNYSNTLFNVKEYMPFVAMALVTNLDAGQTASVQMPIFDGNNGGTYHDLVSIYVLGINNTGTFYIGCTNSALPPLSFPAPTKTAISKYANGPSGGLNENGVAVLENPIRCHVLRNPYTQTYQAQICVVNPFVVPLLATVTQTLPLGITVLATDGTLVNSSIVWTNEIAPGAFTNANFTFSIATTPGAATNLPSPNVVFSDLTPTNQVAAQSVTVGFKGLFPVQANTSVPTTLFGTDAPMQVTVTNWTGTGQTGSLTIALADSTGATVTNFTQSFFVSGSGNTGLAFTMPGMLPPGQYSLTGSLSVGGGTGQVIAGVYTVQLPPVILGTASPQPLTANGLNLSLQGAVGSNYLIEASTDLTSWTPILYFPTTNSLFYFTDPTATNSNMKFYRAVMP